MRTTKHPCTAVAMSFMLMSCGLNNTPYPKENLHDRRQLVVFGIDCDPIMEFTEKRLAQHKITVYAPPDALTKIDIDGLPPGAEFSENTGFLSWEPPVNSGLNLDRPGERLMTYPISILLRSLKSPGEVRRKVILLVRHD